MEFNIEDYLNSLPLSTTKINVSKKRLTYLPDLSRFKQLTHLICSSNKLTYLPPLNNNLQELICYNNNIYNENIAKYKYDYRNIKIIQTLRNFRNTYYLLKFKKHFKRWLWEKVREPKIMAKFHPSHLEALEDTDDLEVFLEDWIK